MAIASPLHTLHEQAEASFLRFGPAQPEAPAAAVVETYGELEAEYAALRRGCILLDLPHRAALRITGAERLDFLNHMVTQELKGLEPFRARRTFWLNRKGRIDADLRLIHLNTHTIADLDILCAARSAASLSSFIFTEDVAIEDITQSTHRLALHGPGAIDLLAAVSQPASGPALAELADGHATQLTIRGHSILVDRQDATGEIGLELLVDLEAALPVYTALAERCAALAQANAGGAILNRHRPAGWHAFNIARIENGWPLYNLDFGPDSLPAETGVLNDRVSFKKGCYLGQEVVARMHSLGHPKQQLVALRIGSTGREDPAWQPHAGSPVFPAPTDPAISDAKPIGAVTSSTRSPMLGDDIICFAQVKWDHTTPGTPLTIHTPAGPAPTAVQDALTFWRRS